MKPASSTYDDENPPPSSVVAYSAHVADSPCKDSTKSSSKRCAAEEERDAILAFIALVPVAQVEHHTWEQPRLCDTESGLNVSLTILRAVGLFPGLQESHDEKASKVLSNTHQGRDNAPGHGQSGKPEFGSRPL